MKQEILNKIKEIEIKENLKVLFLIESGSRAWGWESEDSDYDVRGVYIQDHNQFKDLKSQINLKEGMFDIELWDLKKFLKLMENSNPSVWEWLSSDIIYIDSPLRKDLKELFIERYSEYALKKHYVSMAKQNFHKYINQVGDKANLKKYLYIIRSIACVDYIDTFGNPPPKNYEEVIVYLPGDIQIFFDKILKDKKKSESLEGSRNRDVENFIVSYFDKEFKKDKSKFKNLGDIYNAYVSILKYEGELK